MAKITLIIYGEPIALKRPKFHNIKTKDGREFTNTYDPSKKDKKTFLYAALSEHMPDKPIEGPIELNVVFYMSRPKNHYGTGKNSDKLKSWAPQWHTVRPDLDNCLKMLMDSFNETYWKDDSQICNITAKKIYTELQPRTEITINIL